MYPYTLKNYFDDSEKEKEAEPWFNEKWNNESWPIRNCPGKDVLKQIRDWCQNKYSLTVTNNKLVEALDELPDDLKEIFNNIFMIVQILEKSSAMLISKLPPYIETSVKSLIEWEV